VLRSNHVKSASYVASHYGVADKTAAEIVREVRRARLVEANTEEAVRDGVQQFNLMDTVKNPASVKSSLR